MTSDPIPLASRVSPGDCGPRWRSARRRLCDEVYAPSFISMAVDLLFQQQKTLSQDLPGPVNEDRPGPEGFLDAVPRVQRAVGGDVALSPAVVELSEIGMCFH